MVIIGNIVSGYPNPWDRSGFASNMAFHTSRGVADAMSGRVPMLTFSRSRTPVDIQSPWASPHPQVLVSTLKPPASEFPEPLYGAFEIHLAPNASRDQVGMFTQRAKSAASYYGLGLYCGHGRAAGQKPHWYYVFSDYRLHPKGMRELLVPDVAAPGRMNAVNAQGLVSIGNVEGFARDLFDDSEAPVSYVPYGAERILRTAYPKTGVPQGVRVPRAPRRSTRYSRFPRARLI